MTIDIIFLIVLIYGFVQGIKKGLFSEIATLLGIFLGIWGAINFSQKVGEYISDNFKLDQVYISLISFGVTFLSILVLTSMLGKILTKILETVHLGFINKILGGVFGLIKFTIIMSVIIIIFDSFNSKIHIVDKSKLDKSLIYNPLKQTAITIIPKARRVLGI